MAKYFLRPRINAQWGGVRADPLRDVQQEPPVDRCRDCGGELYRWDRTGVWGGRRLCPCCAEEYDKMEAKKREP